MSLVEAITTELYLVTGLTEETFLQGYNRDTNTWNKAKTIMSNKGKIFTCITTQQLIEAALKEDRNEAVDQDLEEISGLWHATSVALGRAEVYKSKPLLLGLKYPECKVDGIDYVVEGNDNLVRLKPAIARVDSIFAVTEPMKDYTDRSIRQIWLKEVTKQYR